MTWTYNNEPLAEIPEGYQAFVYCITCVPTGRKYIGKKLAFFSKTTYRMTTLKNGTKKRKRIRGKIDSDWRDYYGSSEALLADIKALGADKFTREILYFCRSKAECSYIEAREQFTHKVLESNDYYNGQISVRVHGSHILNKIQLNG